MCLCTQQIKIVIFYSLDKHPKQHFHKQFTHFSRGAFEFQLNVFDSQMRGDGENHDGKHFTFNAFTRQKFSI